MATSSGRGHVEKLREMYRLWGLSKGASVQPWLDLLGDSIRFRSLGAAQPEVAFSQHGISRADVARYFRELNRDWEMQRYDVEDMISEGDRVAVLASCAWRNRATGKVAETLKADFFRFEGGLVVEFTEFFDTAGAAAAARP